MDEGWAGLQAAGLAHSFPVGVHSPRQPWRVLSASGAWPCAQVPRLLPGPIPPMDTHLSFEQARCFGLGPAGPAGQVLCVRKGGQLLAVLPKMPH